MTDRIDNDLNGISNGTLKQEKFILSNIKAIWHTMSILLFFYNETYRNLIIAIVTIDIVRHIKIEIPIVADFRKR